MNLDWIRQRGTHTFFRTLPWRSRLVIFAAVFFTFGSLGFIEDTWDLPKAAPWPCVALSVLYVGLVSVSYLAAISTSGKLVPFAVGFQLLAAKYVLPPLCALFGPAQILQPGSPAFKHRLTVDGIGCMACVVIGYAVFIRFIASEGRKHMRLRTEVALAERIHSTLVPPVASSDARFEIFGTAEPSSEVGGDLLDVVEREAGPVICVADVSGHGVSAGSFMGMVKSAIRMRLQSSDALDTLLDDLNDVVRQLRSPEMFVTIAALRFDATNVAEVALAGHLPVLIVRRSTGAIDQIENAHPPLGVVERQKHGSTRVAFAAGDLFVVLTDGLTEVANRAGEQLGIDGVTAVLKRHAQEDLAAIHAAVLAAARAHGKQTDDQTLLAVRAR